MSALVMWINSHEAKIFKFEPEGVQFRKIEYKGKHHVSEVHGRNHSKSEGDSDKFYHEVIKDLERDKNCQWLIVGPGLAHTHFKHILDKEYPQLSKCVVGVESMQEVSEGQIKDYAHRFFKHKGVFEAL